MLDAHPHLAVIHETEWLAKWFLEGRGTTPEGVVTPALIGKLSRHRRFTKLGVSLAHVVPEGSDQRLHYSEFVTRLFDEYGRQRGKDLVGEKSPRYVLRMQTLHELWPSARFVHLIRDGRDVFLSSRSWSAKRVARGAKPTSIARLTGWKHDPVGTAALWWKWHVQAGRDSGSVLGEGLYREVGYESLVARPEQECRRLAAFLELPYDAAMLSFHAGRSRETDPTAALDAKEAWLPVTRGLRNWRTEMTDAELERFEALAGDLLRETGYKVGDPPARSKKLSEVLEMFRRDVRTRGFEPPEFA
jgi:hypothetical protein